MIYLGTDHRGYKMKEELREYLTSRGYQVVDLGAKSEEPGDDYPGYAEKVARAVVTDPNNRGILLCGSGAGVCIAANKINGVRAAVAWNEGVSRAIRNDDNANVLCLPADQITAVDAKKIVQVFLDASFGGEERYKRRLRQIQEIETKH